MKTKDLTIEQLHQYFMEHIRYEIQMLLNATSAIRQSLPVPRGVEHMPVESYAIHLRNLITFLYPPHPPRDSDVCAKDFFVKENTWAEIRPVLDESLENARIRANKEIGHLTTLRQSGTPESKQWDVKKLSAELLPLIKLFAESADKVKIDSDLEDLLAYHSKIS